MRSSKWLKYLSQFLSAAVFAFCAAAGLRHTVPSLEAMDWPSVIEASPVVPGNEDDWQKNMDDKEETDPKTEEDHPDESDTQNSDQKGVLNDGIYYGTGEGYGGIIKVKVSISGGKISSIDVIEADGETPDFLAKAKGIIPLMLSEQSANVDAVSGATLSSNGIRAAVSDALSKAGSKETVTVSPTSAENSQISEKRVSSAASYTKPSSGWKDGTYVGSARGYGGTVTVNVTISGGKISSITADGPEESPSYWTDAQAVIPRMISAQDPHVDVVSGATYSSNGIINAVIAALEQAGNGNMSSPTLPAAEKKDQTITTGKNSYSVKVGDPGFSLGARAETALIFRSSKTTVAKVSKKGKVTIVGEGTTKIKITARADSIYKKAEKTVTVTVSPADSLMKTGRATVQPDGNGQFEAYEFSLIVTFQNGRPISIAKPESNTDPINQGYLDNAFNKMESALLKVWDVSKVDTVDAVSGATCSSKALREAYKDALSKVNSVRKDQTLSGAASGYDLTVDQNITLKIKGNQGKLSFSSDKESVAKVNSSGKVTAVSSGRAVITVTAAKTDSYNEAKKTIVVNVVGKQQAITMPEHADGGRYLFMAEDVGKTIALQAGASGGAALTYQTSNADVAAVSREGVVTLVGEGTAIITVTAKETKTYQSAAARFWIEIKEPDAPTEPAGITGTFSGSAKGYGGTVTADVVLDNGVITNITAEGARETRTYWLKAKTLLPLMISGQTWDVDAVSGATYSSNGIRDAVKNALEAAGIYP